jgi:hypothetical protein
MADGLPRSFAAVLDDLRLHPVGRRQQYTTTELAQLVSDAGGGLAERDISRPRQGLGDNPTMQAIEDLAAALQVCPAAFVDAELDDYVALRDAGVILELVTRMAEEAPRRSPQVRRRALDAVLHAVQTSGISWVFSREKDDAQ